MIWYLLGLVEIGPRLGKVLRKAPDDTLLHIYTVMAIQPDHKFARGLPSPREVAQYYRDITRRATSSLVKDIESGKVPVSKYRVYWVNNSVELWIKKKDIEKLLNREDMVMVELVPRAILHRPAPIDRTKTPSRPLSLWNIHMIGADSVWVRFGYNGSGVIVGSMDTGVDTTHPVLRGKVIKMKAFTTDGDPSSDVNGHGTHTAGTILGGNGYSDGNIYIDDIGVAPGARLVHAKIFENSGTAGDIMGGFQWIASLKADSGVDIRVVNNSWGSPNRYSTYYWNAVLTWKNLGIFPVFSIGNEGQTGYSTAGTPGNYPTVMGVGAVNSSDALADFSSKGPAPDQAPWTTSSYWYIPDWNRIKPDIAAPGVSIYSSIPGGGYASYSGTSMAAPHVSGAAAILLQINPSLTPDKLYKILIYTSHQRPLIDYPNYQYGWGRLDLMNAVMSLQGPLVVKGNVEASYGTGWDPGETMTFDVQLINAGASTAYNVQGTISSPSPYVSIIDADATWGDLLPGDTAFSIDGGFTVRASDSASAGTGVYFNLVLTYEDSTSTQITDTLYVSFYIMYVPHPTYDVDAGNMILTISNNGAFPSEYFSGTAPYAGTGLVFNNANQLYYGSFAIGISPSSVLDMWYGEDTITYIPNSDFISRNGIFVVGPPPYASFKATSDFMGYPLKVIQDAITIPGMDNAVILRYWITNTGTTDKTGLYSGLFMDFDIGGPSGYNSNTGGIDATRNLVYLNYGSTYAGVTYLGSNVPVSLANISPISNPTYVYGPTPDSIKYLFLSGSLTNSASSASDYSVVVSAGPFDLLANAQDTVILTFVVLTGTSLNQLQETVDSLLNLVPLATAEKPSPHPMLSVRYSGGKPLILLNTSGIGHLTLQLYSPNGRLLKNLLNGPVDGSLLIHVPDDLKPGIYILRANDGRKSETIRMIIH